MRAVAELPHPECKITIFAMNNKFLVKLERGAFEQTYKLNEVDVTDGVNGIFQILDDEFIATVVERFKGMRDDFHAAYARHES